MSETVKGKECCGEDDGDAADVRPVQGRDGDDVEANESVGVAYDGYSYAFDLCPPHAKSFHATVQTMIGWSSERTRAGTGRRSPRTTPSPASKAEPSPTSDRERLRAIRQWARDNGYPELGNRGRIPQHIVAEHEAAHGG